jgi:hypothetical protein
VTGIRLSKRVIGTLLMVLVMALLHTGCSDRKAGKPKIKRIEGVAEKIDLQNNSVSMRFTASDGKERVLEGTVREGTNVKINGRDEKLEHVRPGDKVIVSGYREGEGDQVKLIATMVEVIRPEGADWKSTGQATSKASENKPAPATITKPAGTTTAPAGASEAKKPG